MSLFKFPRLSFSCYHGVVIGAPLEVQVCVGVGKLREKNEIAKLRKYPGELEFRNCIVRWTALQPDKPHALKSDCKLETSGIKDCFEFQTFHFPTFSASKRVSSSNVSSWWNWKFSELEKHTFNLIQNSKTNLQATRWQSSGNPEANSRRLSLTRERVHTICSCKWAGDCSRLHSETFHFKTKSFSVRIVGSASDGSTGWRSRRCSQKYSRKYSRKYP